jgi:hypothetical protein
MVRVLRVSGDGVSLVQVLGSLSFVLRVYGAGGFIGFGGDQRSASIGGGPGCGGPVVGGRWRSAMR